MNPPRTLTYHGTPWPAPKLARTKGLKLTTLLSRIDRLGWTVERAADTPAAKKFARGGGRPRNGAPRKCPEIREHPDGRAYARWREGKRVIPQLVTHPPRYVGDIRVAGIRLDDRF